MRTTRFSPKMILLASAFAVLNPLGAAFVAAPALAAPPPGGFADLVEKVQPAVVNISTTTQVEIDNDGIPDLPPGHPLEQFFKRYKEQQDGAEKKDGEKPITREARSLGSGFIIESSGFVVTNNHVISGRDQQTVVDKIQVILGDGTKYDARLVGRDVASDLAVLKIEPKAPLPVVKFGSSDSIRVGDWAIAVGNPFGVGQSVTAGIVSGLHRDVEGAQYPFFIQTDASINRGNSGGPMFNMNGEVIGINTAIYSPSGGNVGIGFSIPSSYAQKIVEQLKNQGRVRRGYLGVLIQSLDEDTATGLGLKSSDGAAITTVNSNTPAARAGVKVGDIITAFNGKKIANSRELSLAVSEAQIGSAATLDLIRDGKPLQLKVVVGDLPGGDPARIAQTPPQTPRSAPPAPQNGVRQSLGLTLKPLDAAARTELKLPADAKGALIEGVAANSDAADKGLQPGDLITAIGGQAVAGVDDAAALVDAARKAGRTVVTLTVRRGENLFFRGVKLQPMK